MDMSLSKLLKLVMDREDWHTSVHGVTKSWTQLSNWTEQKHSTQYETMFYIYVCVCVCVCVCKYIYTYNDIYDIGILLDIFT